MSVRVIRDEGTGRYYPILSAKKGRAKYEAFKTDMKFKIFLLILLLPFSPLGFFLVLMYLMKSYKENIKDVFFKNLKVKSIYRNMFKPIVTDKVYVKVGYRVYFEDWENHKAILGLPSKERGKRLAQKEKEMKKKEYMQVGFDRDFLTRHLVFAGTTGAGKTETVMTLLEAVIKGGGGYMMIDGKADMKMEMKLYSLHMKHKYETQFQIINLLKAETTPESNTFNIALTYPSAFKTAEFFGELLDTMSSGGGDNADYFKGRGKVLVSCEASHLKLREISYGEKFTVADFVISSSVIETNNIFYLNYCVSQDLEMLIRKKTDTNKWFGDLMMSAKASKTPSIEYLQHIDWLIEYVSRNPQYIKKVQNVLGIDYGFIKSIHSTMFMYVSYMTEISPEWIRYAEAVAFVMYKLFKMEERNFLYTEPNFCRITDIRKMYLELRKKEDSNYYRHINAILNKNAEYKTLYENALDFESEQNVEKIPPTAVQQHGYAQQQWTRLFNILSEYAHIFNSPYPEVEIEDLFKNNKCLYVQLPATEFTTDLVKILGAIFVLMFKTLASIALGGEKQDTLPVQFKIYQDLIKPVPLYVAIFDEYGSYPVPKAMPLLLAQTRSLNCSIIISVQDFASLQPMREDRWEKSRTVANTSKILLESKDDDIIEYMGKFIKEVDYLEGDIKLDYLNKNNFYVDRLGGYKIERRKPIDEKIVKEFSTGFGMLIHRDDEPILFQSYYAGGKESKLYICKLNHFDEAYERV